MSCYFRYLNDVFDEAGIRVTPDNKQALDQAIHTFVQVGFKSCMPDCWSKVKVVLQNPFQRAKLVAALKRFNSASASVT